MTEVPAFQKVITRSYEDVQVSPEGIDTAQFLEATKSMIDMFDLFGSSAFSVVQNDMRNNVIKIESKFQENPTEYNTLENLMAKEAYLKRRVATEAVLWLKRGLEFTAKSLLHSLDHPEDELTVSFSLAYDSVLRPYHSFIVRPIFNLAMNACPWRRDFYERIGVQTPESTLMMRNWLLSLIKLLDILNKDFEKHPEYSNH
ncbi:glycolipid transfer protein domain-containing protein [Gilbertella persicaria]|uniref:glycolipid transfer protein domain-containing protein n=1 Tax=Gilbertella persicaria TaxID=101096 RepID=UPI00221EE0BC|nr:glycolipid transfer protein domain-containing protein [Gilbertella persicaria]KAI8078199.1 glycolipid transfer protein domain-containing protein [Gilbertella persicaria]